MAGILREGRNCWWHGPCEEAGLLVDGAAYYAAFYDAAVQARQTLLITGWQFDSQVALLRGEQARRAPGPVALLPFLGWLCERTPSLRIYVLAWDFSVFYSLEREWFQQWLFAWNSNPRLLFRFDSTAPVTGSQHQKFVVVDQRLAFVGGIDLCASRWDDRQHLAAHPDRVNPDGEPSGAYHDVQAWVRGERIARQIATLFQERWAAATGTTIDLPTGGAGSALSLPASLSIRSDTAALCRTAPAPIDAPQQGIREIETLVTDAILSAERLIYIETQYFSSGHVLRAFFRRLRDRARSRLEVVIVMPEKAEAFKEEVAIGVRQARVLRALSRIACCTGHNLGIYFSGGIDGGGSTYVHAKLMIVDDKLLTVGSANLTNRSMGLDTELNLSWEASTDSDPLAGSIRAVRQELLAEHAGLERGSRQFRELAWPQGLVERLDSLAASPGFRIQKHSLSTSLESKDWVRALGPKTLDIDPSRPPLHAILGGLLPFHGQSWFANGISSLTAALKKTR